VVTIAETSDPIICANGMAVIPQYTFDNAPALNVVLIPGSNDLGAALRSDKSIIWIQRQSQQTDYTTAVCTGAFILAKLGRLNGKHCTTHWRYAQTLAEQYPSIFVLENAIYAEGGNVFSSAGVATGIDLALALVERDYGADLAIETTRNLVLYFRRPGNQSQFSEPIELRKRAGTRFRELHDWLLKNISRPELQVETLADFMAMSPRHFSHCFHQ
jgi:transcriptional regulator GlxA family with amidase domain